jgi:hypothetical protein
MAPRLAYPHIEKLPQEPARLERVPGLRVAQIVMDYLPYAWFPDEICRQHSYLMEAEVHAAMGYYYDHQQQIEDAIRAELAAASRHDGSARSSTCGCGPRD